MPTDNTREEITLTITCGNCYQEAEARPFSIGQDINTFYKKHRTRIGKTFCSIDAICIRYNPITKAQEQLLDEFEEHLNSSIKTLNISGFVEIPDGQYVNSINVALWAASKRKEIKESK